MVALTAVHLVIGIMAASTPPLSSSYKAAMDRAFGRGGAERGSVGRCKWWSSPSERRVR